MNPDAGPISQLTTDEALRVLEEMDAAVVVLDASSKLRFANASIARLGGFTHWEDLVGTDIAAIVQRYDIFDEQDRVQSPAAVLSMAQFLSTQEKGRPWIIRYRHKISLHEKWAVFRATAVKDAQEPAQVVDLQLGRYYSPERNRVSAETRA